MHVEYLSGDLLARTVLCAPDNEAALRGIDTPVEDVELIVCPGIIEVL